MIKTLNVKKLGQHTGNYEFTIQQNSQGIFISIPGYGGGRDGPTTAEKPEQLQWMKEKTKFKEVWYLTWQCKSEKSLRKFINKIQPK